MAREEPTVWGCSCGRLCRSDDDECESCDAPREKGVELRTVSARNKFLKRHEKLDRRMLEGAKTHLVEVETSYRDTEREFDKHCHAMNVGLEPWFEDQGYGPDPLDVFYGDGVRTPAWMWG